MLNDTSSIGRDLTRDLTVRRIRHATKLRTAEVVRVVEITPHLVRITLCGPDLRDFESASFDDHVKVFFPRDGELQPQLPVLGPDGRSAAPAAGRPIARDFTPRRFDREAGELDLEFALHESGPATQWAAQARAGQSLGIGGPRGSMIIPTAFDWHLLIGDDTALPAIGRRLEELPSQVRAIVIAEVSDRSAQVQFGSRADMDVIWCHRADGHGSRSTPPASRTSGSPRSGSPGSESYPASLLAALRELPALPSGEGYVWAAAEAAIVRQVRLHLVAERGIDKSRIRAAAYWKQGDAAVHEVIDD